MEEGGQRASLHECDIEAQVLKEESRSTMGMLENIQGRGISVSNDPKMGISGIRLKNQFDWNIGLTTSSLGLHVGHEGNIGFVFISYVYLSISYIIYK